MTATASDLVQLAKPRITGLVVFTTAIGLWLAPHGLPPHTVVLTLIGTVLGEMFAAQHGLGYLLMNAIGLYNVDVIMSVTFLLVVFAAGVNGVLLAIDRRLHFRA